MNDLASTLYRAPYVVPVTSAVIRDGGVLVRGGRIVAVDQFRRLRPQAGRVVELEERVITPALINCHCHLELSYLAALGQDDALPANDITAWIRGLLACRAEATPDETIIEAGRAALAKQHRRGVALVADIGNRPASRELGQGQGAEQLFFQELLGLTETAATAALAALEPEATATAHAPYSCHPDMIRALKEKARQRGGLFPIHVAESVDEITFLRTGTGPFLDFIGERLRQVGALAAGQSLSDLLPPPPGSGAVTYLQALGVLDACTICVHAVHLLPGEAELIAASGAKVCLCPGSNRRLGVGTAPLPLLLRQGILPGLGTDSLTSNTTLDLWQEMRLLHEDHPAVAPERIFRMATLGGAETLGRGAQLGALAPDHVAKMLSVAYNGSLQELYPFLVSRGVSQEVEWLGADHDH